jgi:hypothetical protein
VNVQEITPVALGVSRRSAWRVRDVCGVVLVLLVVIRHIVVGAACQLGIIILTSQPQGDGMAGRRQAEDPKQAALVPDFRRM